MLRPVDALRMEIKTFYDEHTMKYVKTADGVAAQKFGMIPPR